MKLCNLFMSKSFTPTVIIILPVPWQSSWKVGWPTSQSKLADHEGPWITIDFLWVFPVEMSFSSTNIIFKKKLLLPWWGLILNLWPLEQESLQGDSYSWGELLLHARTPVTESGWDGRGIEAKKGWWRQRAEKPTWLKELDPQSE